MDEMDFVWAEAKRQSTARLPPTPRLGAEQPSDGLSQMHRREWLSHKRNPAGNASRLHPRLHTESGHQQNWHGMALLAQRVDELNTGHSRHHNVDDHEVKPLGAPLQRLS